MNGKRLCSMSHPANLRGERASRRLAERAMGVLWNHSSVNLVEPRSIALAAAASPAVAEDQEAVSIPDTARNRRMGGREDSAAIDAISH